MSANTSTSSFPSTVNHSPAPVVVSHTHEQHAPSKSHAPVAAITGANRGVGFAIATGLVNSGFQVFLLVRDMGKGMAARDKIRARIPGAQVGVVHVDLLELSTIPAAAAQLHMLSPSGIDVLINCAGFAAFCGQDPSEPPAPFIKVARCTIATHYFGTYGVCKELAPLMKPSGRIVNVSDICGQLSSGYFSPMFQQRLADPSLTVDKLDAFIDEFMAHAAQGTHVEMGWPSCAYACSKATENAMTRVLARDPMLTAKGITCNVMCCTPQRHPDAKLSNVAQRIVNTTVETALWLALDPITQSYTGMCFAEQKMIPF